MWTIKTHFACAQTYQYEECSAYIKQYIAQLCEDLQNSKYWLNIRLMFEILRSYKRDENSTKLGIK